MGSRLAGAGGEREPRNDRPGVRPGSEGGPQELGGELGDLLTHLFRAAKVSATRVSARGERYSIIDGALREFVTWEHMPWE